jgi:hypothetical protein
VMEIFSKYRRKSYPKESFGMWSTGERKWRKINNKIA